MATPTASLSSVDKGDTGDGGGGNTIPPSVTIGPPGFEICVSASCATPFKHQCLRDESAAQGRVLMLWVRIVRPDTDAPHKDTRVRQFRLAKAYHAMHGQSAMGYGPSKLRE